MTRTQNMDGLKICFVLFEIFIQNSIASLDVCYSDVSGVEVTCSQICVVDSECQCQPGYVLNVDRHSCQITGDEAVLVFTSDNNVYVHFLESNHTQVMLNGRDVKDLVQHDNFTVTILVFGPDQGLYGIHREANVVVSMQFDKQFKGTQLQYVVDNGLVSPTGLAVDWSTRNLYIVDIKLGAIIVCTLKGDNCSILVDGLQNPYSIAIDQVARSLYWTAWGVSTTDLQNIGSIYQSQMDGTGPTVVVEGLIQPKNLLVDQTSSSLYWLTHTNSGSYSVDMLKLGTQNSSIVKSIVTITSDQPPSMCVLTDHLYIVDSDHIIMVNKWTGQLEGGTVLNGLVKPGAISVYHPVLYQTVKDNVCSMSPCSHMCVPSNNLLGYRCLCPLDMELSSQLTCQKKRVSRLIASDMSGMYEVPLDYIGGSGYRARLLRGVATDTVSYDAANQQVIYHNSRDRTLNTLAIPNTQDSRILYRDIGYIEGMAVDTLARNLYWTTLEGKVYAGRLDGSFYRSIVADLSRPRGITLDLQYGYMYICDWGTRPQVLQCEMDGSQCVTFTSIPGGHPNMITMDTSIPRSQDTPLVTGVSHDLNRRIYWTDSKLDTIGYMDLDGSMKRGEIYLTSIKNSHAYGIVTTADRIYFTDLNTRHTHYIDKYNTSVIHDVQLGLGSLYGFDMVTMDNIVAKENGCSQQNGGCSHMCLAKPEGQRSCWCPDGLVLATNLTTCTDFTVVTAITAITGKPNIKTFGKPKQPVTSRATKQPVTSRVAKQPVTYNVAKQPVIIDITTLRTIGTKPITMTTLIPSNNHHNNSFHSNTNDVILDISVNHWMVVGLVVGGCLLATIVVVVACYFRKRHAQKGWLVGMMRFVKNKHGEEESEGLVSCPTLDNPNFQNFDDLDYPDKFYHHTGRRDNKRETSMVSMDSAFTEMRDCSSYSVDRIE